MRNVLLAVALGLTIGLTGACGGAQSAPSDARERIASERRGIAFDAGGRITALLTETLGDPAISAPTSVERLAAAIEAKSAMIANARAELSDINRSLLELDPLSGATDGTSLRAIDEDVRGTAAFALKADAVLEGVQAVPEAVRTRNREQLQAAMRAVTSASVLLQETQALTMRRQGALVDSRDPSSGQFAAMACFSDGQAAMQAGMSGLRPQSLAISQIAAAEACMQREIARGRSTIEPFSQAGPANARLSTLHESLYDALAESAAWLGGVREDLARGEGAAAIAAKHNPELMRINARIRDLSARTAQMSTPQH